jgi:hypothetical protein
MNCEFIYRNHSQMFIFTPLISTLDNKLNKIEKMEGLVTKIKTEFEAFSRDADLQVKEFIKVSV